MGRAMALIARDLLPVLHRLPPARRYVVGFSGGLDSTVLLHVLVSLRDELPPLQAVHVNHGLQAQAANWEKHCAQVCQDFDCPLDILHVDARPSDGESPEAAARSARYDALREYCRQGDLLLTAHHQDDQAETLLNQLLRGAGPAGLSAMPRVAPFSPSTWHARPLLEVTRPELKAYAEAAGLTWIDDPTNTDTHLARNYFRHHVMPVLTQHWPSAGATLARAARHQAEAWALLQTLGRQDIETGQGSRPDCLSVQALRRLPTNRARNAIRVWLHDKGLPMPSEARLARILEDVLTAGEDRMPCVDWPGAEVRRYRDDLYAFAPLPPHDPTTIYKWDPSEPLELSSLNLCLTQQDLLDLGVDVAALDGPLSVRFRQGGERCHPKGRQETHELKKLLQEEGVPPWERERIPLVYAGERLIAAVGFWACE
ncbi:MAG: tRNA lysidine(34) synthetase TilS [Gammaproteobacteria bacterium]